VERAMKAATNTTNKAVLSI
jgi:hypothetical protein